MTPKLSRPAVLEVEWLDTMGYSGWAQREERLRSMDKTEEMDHVSTGYLLKRTAQYIALTQSFSRTGNVGDSIQIPRRAIKRVTVLKQPSRE